MGVNAAAYYERDTYAKRLPKLGALRKNSKADLVLVCESGTYANGQALNKAFGWSGVRAGTGAASFVLHGAVLGITTAAHWNPAAGELLDEGQYDTLPGSTHNGATWTLLRIRGVYVLTVITHLQYLPKGPNSVKTKYDTERQNQLSGALKQANALAAAFATKYKVNRIPVIVGEDFNSSRTDGYDGPGAAMKAHGFRDVERAKQSGRDAAIIDRLAVSDGITVARYEAIDTNGATDHKQAVIVDLTISNT